MVKVAIDQGTLIGNECLTENGFQYYGFLDIPYAKPPLGNLRFKNPQPPERWIGDRDATSCDDKHICYQFDHFKKRPNGSEDCLYLNVFTPKLPSHSSKYFPVMIYIHGGAFIVGSGTNKDFSGPDFLIEENVVVVTINYRLGVFGFLSLDIPEATGNMGLKDQVMALKWVQNNISNFCGDKDCVSIFGISAGSASVEFLVSSSLGKDLFHKAIMQSGSILSPWAIEHDIKNQSIKVARELGYQQSSDNEYEIHKFLLRQSCTALGAASWKVTAQRDKRHTSFGFCPCVEKDFGNGEAIFTGNAYNLLLEGKFNRVPVLRGFCEFEGLVTLAINPDRIKMLVENKNFTINLPDTLTSAKRNEYNKKFAKAYVDNTSATEDQEQFAIDFLGDFDTSSCSWIASKLMADKIPLYTYIFAYDGDYNYVKKSMFPNINRKGACHADDTTYIMYVKTSGLKPSTSDTTVRKRIIKMWTNFAKTGNPTPTTSKLIPVQWPRFTTKKKTILKN